MSATLTNWVVYWLSTDYADLKMNERVQILTSANPRSRQSRARCEVGSERCRYFVASTYRWQRSKLANHDEGVANLFEWSR